MISDENGDMWFCEECYYNGNAADEAHRNGLLLMGEDEDEDALDAIEKLHDSADIIQRAWRKYSLRPVRKNLSQIFTKSCAGSQSFTKSCGVESLSLAEFVSIKASDFRDQLVECGTVTYEQMELVSDEKLREAVESSGVLQNYSFTDVWENSTEVLFDVLEELDVPELVEVSKVTATYFDSFVKHDCFLTCMIKGDLTTAHKWYVKKDTLLVQWKEGDKYVVYKTGFTSEYTLDAPCRVDVEVEEMTVEEADDECEVVDAEGDEP
jgi:polyhydroxyalkanoate synthesis regulator phasin